MDSVEVVVVGAGVVGLACARALARAGREVLVLEAQPGIGRGISSRSSEVVHAGLHGEPGSLKAQLCVHGRSLLYAYCAERGVDHRRCGKLVVATRDEERPALEAVARRAQANGVGSLRWLEAAEARRLEPALRCVAALSSPETGIVDSHGLMLALQADAEAAGALVVFNTRVAGSAPAAPGHAVRTEGTHGGAAVSLRARWVVNAAGLDAPRLALAMQGFASAAVPVARYAKGSYFTLAGRAPFSRLVYPLPEAGGLGVHLTLDLSGRARFGPDVQWVEAPEYGVEPARAEGFYASIRRYWPGLPDGALRPDYAGVRPKIHGPGGHADFRVDGPREHGVRGVVQLFGIESPGLTASMAIAERVARTVAAA